MVFFDSVPVSNPWLQSQRTPGKDDSLPPATTSIAFLDTRAFKPMRTTFAYTCTPPNCSAFLGKRILQHMKPKTRRQNISITWELQANRPTWSPIPIRAPPPRSAGQVRPQPPKDRQCRVRPRRPRTHLTGLPVASLAGGHEASSPCGRKRTT